MDENRREATCVSLFSGIGGLDHGLHLAGFRHLLLCDSDPWRRSVLAARFPGVPIADDVRDVCAGSEPRWAHLRHAGTDADAEGGGSGSQCDLLAGGSPCQDLSVAGQRRGLEAGERSSLFFEMARVIDAVRPRWVLWENVPGAFSSQGGRDFGAVLGTLADLGYGLGWRTLDSRFFGVPQRRRRVFVLGALAVGDPRAAAERAGKVLAVGARCGRHPATGTAERQEPSGASASRAHDGRLAQPLGSHKTNRNDLDGDTYVVGSLTREHGGRSSGRDPDLIVANGLVKRYGKGTDSDATDTMVVAHALEASDGHHGYSSPRGDGCDNLIAAPLTAGGHPNSNMPGRRKEDDENLVTAFHQTQDPIHGDEFTPALGETTIGMGVGIGASVRRLTPTECERLQALPDGWTNPAGDAPDSRRYAGLGDAVTASVAEWIGRRILASGG